LRKGMSEFWEAFEGGADAAIDTMGRKVKIGGVEVDAVPTGVELDQLIASGGKRNDVNFTLQVSVAVGAAVEDGALVEYQTLRGRVDKMEFFGGGYWVIVGPENRWSGDE
jgi:hypothetical protein